MRDNRRVFLKCTRLASGKGGKSFVIAGIFLMSPGGEKRETPAGSIRHGAQRDGGVRGCWLVRCIYNPAKKRSKKIQRFAYIFLFASTSECCISHAARPHHHHWDTTNPNIVCIQMRKQKQTANKKTQGKKKHQMRKTQIVLLEFYKSLILGFQIAYFRWGSQR